MRPAERRGLLQDRLRQAKYDGDTEIIAACEKLLMMNDKDLTAYCQAVEGPQESRHKRPEPSQPKKPVLFDTYTHLDCSKNTDETVRRGTKDK